MCCNFPESPAIESPLMPLTKFRSTSLSDSRKSHLSQGLSTVLWITLDTAMIYNEGRRTVTHRRRHSDLVTADSPRHNRFLILFKKHNEVAGSEHLSKVVL